MIGGARAGGRAIRNAPQGCSCGGPHDRAARGPHDGAALRPAVARAGAAAATVRRVLITDGHMINAMAAVRYLGAQGLECHVVGSSPLAVASFSRFCAKYHLAPCPPEEAGFVEALEQVILQEGIDQLIPIGFSSCFAAARHHMRLQRLCRLEIASEEAMETGLSKQKTYALAEELGVPYPRALYPANWQEVGELAAGLTYPVVIKGIWEAGDNVVRIVESPERLMPEYQDLCRRYHLTEEQLPMLQEFVPGPDRNFLSIELLYQNGVCRRVLSQGRIRKITPVGPGSCMTTRVEPDLHQAMKEYATRLLDALHWHGVACIEFKQDSRTGQVKLIEINPKFWYSLEMALIAGINFPHLLVRMAQGEELDYSEEYDRNLKFKYTLSGDFQQLFWNPRSLPSYLWDCLNPRVRSNVRLDDLRPNLVEFRVALRDVLPPGWLGAFGRARRALGRA